MSEQFRLDEFRGNGCTVQRHKRSGSTGTSLVDGASHKLFTSSSFTENADARFAGCHAVDLCRRFTHGLALPDDLVLSQSLLQLLVFGFQSPQRERVLNR